MPYNVRVTSLVGHTLHAACVHLQLLQSETFGSQRTMHTDTILLGTVWAFIASAGKHGGLASAPLLLPLHATCRVTQTRAFDTEPASSSYASGFIVDRARGIILTNRHVVTPGEGVQQWSNMAAN